MGVKLIKLEIRAASIDDIDNLQTLLIETIESTCKPDYSQDQIRVWVSSAKKEEHWNRFLNQQFSQVAEIDNKAVGFGSLDDGNHIYFLYVHKDYLGMGVASGVYEALKHESLKHGYTTITANVSKTAVPFFEKKGFTIVKENRNVLENIIVINYRMINNQIAYNTESRHKLRVCPPICI